MERKHRHHIIPRHAGGSDDPSNIKTVTVEEHAEEHRRLWSKEGREYDRVAWLALSGMIGKEDARILASKASLSSFHSDPVKKEHWLKNVREKHVARSVSRNRWIGAISSSLKGKRQSKETCKKRSDSLKKLFTEGLIDTRNMWKGKALSREHIDKMSAGRVSSSAWKLSVTNDEYRENASLASKKRISVVVNGKTFRSIRHASESTGINYNHILLVRKGIKRDDRIAFL